jgi:hypothetical protein
VLVEWDWGEGNPPDLNAPNGQHTYALKGTYPIIATVRVDPTVTTTIAVVSASVTVQ